jgi:peptidyl-prolyl cis-trans isomerase C
MFAAALLLAVAVSSAADQTVAQVDSVRITRADLDERLRVLRARRLAAAPAPAVDALVDEALLAGEARRLGLDRDPAVVAEIESERRRLAAETFVADATPEPTEAQLRELYHQTADSARLVLVKLATEPDARAALERVRSGGDLAAEARRSVDGGLAARLGDTGPVSRAALDPALAAEVFRAAPGAVIGPVQLKLGWAIARVVERTVADEAGLAARRSSIASFARTQIGAQVRSHLVEQLRARAAVSIDEGFLRAVTARPTEKDLDHPIAVVNGKPVPYRAIQAGVQRIASRGGHGAGGARIALARAEADRRVLEDEALAKGFGRSPAVARTLPSIERNLLAAAAAARLAGSGAADLGNPAVRGELKRLRSSARVTVDRGAVAAAERDAR